MTRDDDPLTAPTVPGYDLLEPLGHGATSVVWRARADPHVDPRAGGVEVAVKVVVAGPDAERELAVLSGVRHPHLLELREVVALDHERLAIVTDLLDGGTLAAVVAARGRLRPGEVVTVLVPLAQALSALHATGVLHGDLAPGNVLFTSAGRPALTDLGTTRITGEARAEVYGTAGYVDPVVLVGGEPTAASDVYGLGALGWLALTGAPPPSPVSRPPLRELAPSAPDELVSVIESAVDPDPARRPAPLDLAVALHAAVPAEPVWRSGASPVDGGLTCRVRDLAAAAPERLEGARHRRDRTPGRARRAAVLAVVVVAVGLLGGLGATWWWAGPSQASPVTSAAVATGAAPTTPPRPALTDAEAPAVVSRLAAARAAALAQPQRALATGTSPGSPAAQDDARALAALRARGARYAGLSLTPRGVRLLRSAAGSASVGVRLDVSAYDVVVGQRVVQHVPARRGVPSRLELTFVAGRGWQVSRVLSG